MALSAKDLLRLARSGVNASLTAADFVGDAGRNARRPGVLLLAGVLTVVTAPVIGGGLLAIPVVFALAAVATGSTITAAAYVDSPIRIRIPKAAQMFRAPEPRDPKQLRNDFRGAARTQTLDPTFGTSNKTPVASPDLLRRANYFVNMNRSSSQTTMGQATARIARLTHDPRLAALRAALDSAFGQDVIATLGDRLVTNRDSVEPRDLKMLAYLNDVAFNVSGAPRETRWAGLLQVVYSAESNRQFDRSVTRTMDALNTAGVTTVTAAAVVAETRGCRTVATSEGSLAA